MKDTEIVRKIDPLGRITIPREILKIRGIIPSDRTEIEIYVDGNKIILEKFKKEE